MAEFGEFGLENLVGLGVVHHADAVGELRVEADGEQLGGERHRMRGDEVGVREFAGALDGGHQRGP